MAWIRNWFTNMALFDEPLVYQGIVFKTVENFYQAMKVDKTNIAERQKIAAMDPYAAKRYAKTVQLRPDWDKIKLDVMLLALKHKFATGTSWAAELAKHSEPIIEVNNWHDNFWGSCSCTRCGNKGLNHLGRLIETLR